MVAATSSPMRWSPCESEKLNWPRMIAVEPVNNAAGPKSSSHRSSA